MPDAAAPQPSQPFRFARNVTLRDAPGYRVLTIAQPFPGAAPQSTVLLGCGAPDPVLPPELAGAQVVRTPVSGLFAASTTQLPFVTGLGVLDRLTGVGDATLVSDPAVRARAESGGAVAFAPGGTIAAEPVIAAAPPVVLAGGTDDPAFGALRAARIPVLAWTDPRTAYRYLVWGLGSLDGVAGADLPLLVAVLGVGVLGVVALAKPLHAMLLGDDYAATMGVAVRRVRGTVLPLNAVTSLVGAPVVIVVLLRSQRMAAGAVG